MIRFGAGPASRACWMACMGALGRRSARLAGLRPTDIGSEQLSWQLVSWLWFVRPIEIESMLATQPPRGPAGRARMVQTAQPGW